VLEILEVLRQTIHPASLSCVLSAQLLVYESRGIYHEQGMSTKLHVLRKRTKCRSVTRPSERRYVAAVSKTHIVISWYIVHRDRRRSWEYRVETPDIFLISTVHAPRRAARRGGRRKRSLSLGKEGERGGVGVG
jgi:hypothetical protein